MNHHNHRSREELDRRRIDRALAGLEDAVRRCRDEDVRYGTGISALSLFWSSVLMRNGHLNSSGRRLKIRGMDGTKAGGPLADSHCLTERNQASGGPRRRRYCGQKTIVI